jgi:hypothetical protein
LLLIGCACISFKQWLPNESSLVRIQSGYFFIFLIADKVLISAIKEFIDLNQWAMKLYWTQYQEV